MGAQDIKAAHHVTSSVETASAILNCSGQVISDSLIGFLSVDSRSKALGDILPSFECSLVAL